MRFGRKIGNALRSAALAVSALLGIGACIAHAQGTAVVPSQIIYPGETITAAQVNEVPVTNPNLAGGYARTKAEVVGMVSKRTLLPGRTIPTSGLREAFAIKRGSSVRLTFAIGNMVISAAGSPMVDATIGEVIKVRNIDSGTIVTGTVMADGTVQVMAK